MKFRSTKLVITLLTAAACGLLMFAPQGRADDDKNSSGRGDQLDQALWTTLRQHGFTGNIESRLEQRLGRRINRKLAELGQLLWFDTITGLNDDNSCAGCHSPTNGFGDTQSIAIGIDNNGIVGPDRAGPRNMRRTPMAINSAFFPNLMWNSRFVSLSDNPFDNSAGFRFPDPEGLTLSHLPHLLTAQAFIPPTERTEVAGFDFPGDNSAIRAEVLNRLNNIQSYRRLFGNVFPEVRNGGPINFDMFGMAIAEFEFTLTFANAPADEFARGQKNALSDDEKKGALLFFGRARCVECHAVSGRSNEMFSDFEDHVIGVPQIAPRLTNNFFDGQDSNEDFGREQITFNPNDRYKFRTSPIRNVALQPTFFHNGAFTNLEDAVRHHLDVFDSARRYNPAAQRLDEDLAGPTGPIEPVLSLLDPILATPVRLQREELRQLVAFVRNGLLDRRARPENLRKLVPRSVPSGRPMLIFQFERNHDDGDDH
jgi:cytochrome c peroxidase